MQEELDLHGQLDPVHAVQMVQQRVNALMGTTFKRRLLLNTGRGSHSAEQGESKIRNAVLQWCLENRIRLSQDLPSRGGRFYIDFPEWKQP